MRETEDLQEIYDQIVELMKKYEPEMKVEYEFGSRYALKAKGEYEVRSSKTGKTTIKKEPQFAAVIIQSNYVGFYNTAVYVNPGIFDGRSYWDPFKKHLKGKSCFHIKEWNTDMSSAIEDILEVSYQYYKDQGWLDD